MLEFLKAVLFGIVEGITEWLPISSTGHMILLNEFVKLDVSPEFWEMFLVVIQLGAIVAVVILFWNKIFPFQFDKKPVIRKDIFDMWFKVIVACVPAAIVGIFFDDILEKYLYNYVTVSIALIVFGIAFLIIEEKNINQEEAVENYVETQDSVGENDIEQENITADNDIEESNESNNVVNLEDIEKETSAQNVEDTYEEYVVKNGDTLVAICKTKYGSLAKMEEICTINNIKNADYIAPGQKIYLP